MYVFDTSTTTAKSVTSLSEAAFSLSLCLPAVYTRAGNETDQRHAPEHSSVEAAVNTLAIAWFNLDKP